jgi:hypothetical protein
MFWFGRIARAALVGTLVGVGLVAAMRLAGSDTAGGGNWGLGAAAIALLAVALAIRHRRQGGPRDGQR